MTYDEQILQEIDRHAVSDNKKKGGKDEGGGFSDEDEMLPSAIEIVVETGQASTSMLQRRLKPVSYTHLDEYKRQVYGHNIRTDGQMFNILKGYTDLSFYQEHPVIDFNSV